MKDCILLCIERKDKVQKEWEYLFTLNELDFKGALDTWFEYYYGQTSLYVICNNEIVEQFSFKDKKKCDAAFSKGLPVVDDTCKGIKISSHTELMSYMYDMSGVSYLRILEGTFLWTGDREYSERLFKPKAYLNYFYKVKYFWEVPYLISPYILYDPDEFAAPPELGSYICSRSENKKLYNYYYRTRMNFYVAYSRLWIEDLYNLFSKGHELEFARNLNEKRTEITKRRFVIHTMESVPTLYDIEILIKYGVIHDFLIGGQKSPLYDLNVDLETKIETNTKIIKDKPKLVLIECEKSKKSDSITLDNDYNPNLFIYGVKSPTLRLIKGGKSKKKDENK